MTNDSTTIIVLDLGQQVVRLVQLGEQVQEEYRKTGAPIPVRVNQCVNQLTGSLNRLGKQVTRQEDELKNMRALADISQVVNSSLELAEVLRIVMDTIIRLTGAERGFLMLRGDDGILTTRIARNWEQESLDSSEFAISRTVIDRVVNDAQPVLTTNAQEDPRFGRQESIIAYNLRSILCVPLKARGAVTGVIYTDNRIRTGLFTEVERDLLVAFSNQAAIAIENARLFESVRRTLEEVTELKNLMDNVFASIASGVITANIEDQILMCNKAAEDILNCCDTDLVGHRLGEILPPIASELSNLVATVRQTNQHMVGLEYKSTLPRRGQVTLSINLSPLKDAMQETQGVAIVLDDLTEKKRLEAQRRLFERMVSPKVIEQLDPDKLQWGGKRAGITTLFADIRGFTSFSEQVDPEQLVSILNRYLAAAAEAILVQEGTIDKFLGDAVMAWFNAPILQPDHAMRAVRAAIGIREAVQALCQELPPEFRLSFGVGVHYGDAVLGLVGSEKQLEYTAIGDSVNTAKRIQENSAAGQILISKETYAMVSDQVKVRPVEMIHAKGKREPVEVYELLQLA